MDEPVAAVEWFTELDQWLFGYIYDEDAVIVPEVGVEVEFAPTITAYTSFYRGGPLVPIFSKQPATTSRFSLVGNSVRFSSAGAIHMGIPATFSAAGIKMVVEGDHPYDADQDVVIDGMIELDPWTSWAGRNADPLAARWRVERIGRWLDGQTLIPVTRARDRVDSGGRYLLSCTLRRTPDAA